MLFPFHDENPTQRIPFVTVALVAINVAMLFYMGHIERTQGPRAVRAFVYEHGFTPVRLKQLVRPLKLRFDLFPGVHPLQGPVGPERFLELPPNKIDIVLSVFTAMFLHGNLMHLLGNMWFLWLFGNNIEDRLGHWSFLVFYLLGGAFATAVHWAMSPAAALGQPLIGASGAVAVILGAYAVMYPRAKVRTLIFILIFITVVELPALAVLGAWFVIQVVNGLYARPEFGNTVAWWAHVGGFVAGYAIMPLLTGEKGSIESWGAPQAFPPDSESDPYEPLV